jgi:hypothetical protein
MEEKVYNTESKRFLKKDGQQYKKLLSRGYVLINNQLTLPSNKIMTNDSILSNDYINNLPYDVFKEIAKNLDINTINKYCSSHKNINCNNEDLWKMIYDRDHIPYKKQNNFHEYVKYYKQIPHIINEVNLLFELLDEQKHLYNLVIHIRDQIITEIPLLLENSELYVHIKNSNKFILTSMHPNLSKNKPKIIMNKNEFKIFLIDLLYNYPNTAIYSQEGYKSTSYHLRKKYVYAKKTGREGLIIKKIKEFYNNHK